MALRGTARDVTEVQVCAGLTLVHSCWSDDLSGSGAFSNRLRVVVGLTLTLTKGVETVVKQEAATLI